MKKLISIKNFYKPYFLFILKYLSIINLNSFFNFEFIFILIILIYFLVLLEIYFYFNNYKYIPLLYVFISFIFMLYIDFNNKIFLNFNLFILTVITFDIFSYLIGKIFGKNKLTKISPNKTIEGLFGGIIFSFIFSILFSYIFNIIINTKLYIFILLIILFSFIGDIIESYFKRKNNLKNSSNFVPGHGGVFDRFDSFLFSIIIYSVSINILQ